MSERILRLLAAVSLAFNVGCGPGEGGTGTGQTTDAAFAAFGAQAVPICNGALASLLRCAQETTTPGTAVPPAILQGTRAVVFADSASLDAAAVAVVEGNAVKFEARCTKLEFLGEWGASPVGQERFFGTYKQAGSNSRHVGTMVATQRSEDQLVFSLQSLEGTVVFGPVVLQRVENSPSIDPRC